MGDGAAMPERLHADEVPIDRALVGPLLQSQLPDLADLPLQPAPVQGTDNVMFRLGSELAVRLPRKPASVSGLMIELEWLPRLGPVLPLSVPRPVAAGQPTTDYPFPWAVVTWLVGRPVDPDRLGADDVGRFADFVRALESVDPTGGPSALAGQRAGPVAPYDHVARQALRGTLELQTAGRIEPDLIDEDIAGRMWAAALDAPPRVSADVWVHRDLRSDNLLSSDGRLSGVLDFGGLAVGDPAGNTMGAFHLFAAPERERFRAAVGADDATWARARGWALTQGLEALVYYLDTDPAMVAMARRVLRATQEDWRERAS